jgi:acyl-CoA hydrolase
VARRPSDAPLYRELGEEEGLPVIREVFSDVLGRPELCADQIHPNADGYRQMAAGIHAALQRLRISR